VLFKLRGYKSIISGFAILSKICKLGKLQIPGLSGISVYLSSISYNGNKSILVLTSPQT